MPRISRSQLQEKQLQEIIDHFSYLISSLNQSTEIDSFFDQFLTKEEKIMLAKRLVLFMMLEKRYSPVMIQSALRISYETVRTYNSQLESKTRTFRTIIRRLIGREKTKELFTKLDRLLKPLELILDSKRNMRARAKLTLGDWD